ncbi:MAG: 4Fe-4S dicluster domain-containing protein [Syntrophales bacterium]|nr:4Fe-4S dicluster domain-containing protein [Syntrophales bacterium]
MIEEKLSKNVFKKGESPHIQIKNGCGFNMGLKAMVKLCPAGLYREGEDGTVTVSVDGCLECGTCRIICGGEILFWRYPAGGTGVQYRFG